MNITISKTVSNLSIWLSYSCRPWHLLLVFSTSKFCNMKDDKTNDKLSSKCVAASQVCTWLAGVLTCHAVTSYHLSTCVLKKHKSLLISILACHVHMNRNVQNMWSNKDICKMSDLYLWNSCCLPGRYRGRSYHLVLWV